jgi:hypothetical protein
VYWSEGLGVRVKGNEIKEVRDDEFKTRPKRVV